MKKQEFIERYGEEAYQKQLEKNRKWQENNPERVKECTRRWQKNNPERVKEYIKRWQKKNPERVKECTKKWQKKNPEKLKECTRRWQKKNPEKMRAVLLANSYSTFDKEKGRGKCTITSDWIIKHIFNSKCIYCGDSDWTHLGCDRIDNSLPHTPENCVCACRICNAERADRYSVEEFKVYRKLHPRVIDIPKEDTPLKVGGVLKKKAIL